MTGRYQQRVPNLEWAIHPGVKTVGLPPEEITIARLLRDAGYQTGMFGKWHLGYQEPNRPNSHGFDEFFGILSGNVDHFRHVENNQEPDLYHNDEPVREEGYLTELITERAVDFIKQNRENPFFLYVPYNAPHFPIQGPEDEAADVSGDLWGRGGERENYIRMVESLDAGVGRILDTLREAGLEENTLVIFCSDNGGDRLGRNLPLSGKKGTLKEGGIRVPCLMRYPGIIPAGKVSGQAAITMDLSFMLLMAAGVRPRHHLDGMNLMPFITGEKPEVEQTFCWRSTWKNEKAVRWGGWKWYQKDGVDHLHYLPRDPAEEVNLAERNIDIVHGIKTIYRNWEGAMPYAQTVFGDDLKTLDPPTFE
jgi:arylsulfatase A-like enzyme